MRTPRAWVLNLDAEEELQAPENYRASPGMKRRIQEFSRQLVGLVEPGDLVVTPETESGSLEGRFQGQAWCPTPGALRELARVGAPLLGTPSSEVLRRVNGRRFSTSLGQPLPGGTFLETSEDLQSWWKSAATSQAYWVAKSALGFAGRGQKRFLPALPSPGLGRWLEARLGEGEGLQVEPWVDRLGDFGLHGWLQPGGRLVLGSVTRQEIDPQGRWLSTSLLAPVELGEEDLQELRDTGQRVAVALFMAGYHGPFGIDAFAWQDAQGTRRFQPLSEINARFSMGFGFGMEGLGPFPPPERKLDV